MQKERSNVTKKMSDERYNKRARQNATKPTPYSKAIASRALEDTCWLAHPCAARCILHRIASCIVHSRAPLIDSRRNEQQHREAPHGAIDPLHSPCS
jgi:hypothetical protein